VWVGERRKEEEREEEVKRRSRGRKKGGWGVDGEKGERRRRVGR